MFFLFTSCVSWSASTCSSSALLPRHLSRVAELRDRNCAVLILGAWRRGFVEGLKKLARQVQGVLPVVGLLSRLSAPSGGIGSDLQVRYAVQHRVHGLHCSLQTIRAAHRAGAETYCKARSS